MFINEEVEKERERQIGYSMRERLGGGACKRLREKDGPWGETETD